jgi:hypothetical protein
MAKKRLKAERPLPCRMCGSQPRLRSVDVHTSQKLGDTYLFSHIEIECSNSECSKEHRHFGKNATRGEAIKAWNRRNRASLLGVGMLKGGA